MAVEFRRSALVEWSGDIRHGFGSVSAGSTSFTVPITYPRVKGDPAGTTTPEEMLAASHAICYGIGLSSVLEQHGGSAENIKVTATISAEKGPSGIRILASHLDALVKGLKGIEPTQLQAIASETEARCTISIAIRGAVKIITSIAAD